MIWLKSWSFGHAQLYLAICAWLRLQTRLRVAVRGLGWRVGNLAFGVCLEPWFPSSQSLPLTLLIYLLYDASFSTVPDSKFQRCHIFAVQTPVSDCQEIVSDLDKRI